MTPQGSPYRPEKPSGPSGLAQRLMIVIPLGVPGVAIAGLYWLSRSGHLGGWLSVLAVSLFILLLIGCCVFSAWLATADAEPVWRRHLWFEGAVMAAMMQIVIAPVLAGILIVFFIPLP
jgi:hypothetical protein